MHLAPIAAGFLMGFAGSIAPSGPISVLVLERGLSGRHKDGLAVAVGATVAEAIYCGLAVFGLTAAIERHPGAERAMTWIGALTLCLVGLHFLCFRPKRAAAERRPSDGGAWRKQITLGFTLAAANPVMLLTWSAAVATLLSLTGLRLDGGDKIVFVAAVAAGVLGWFWSLGGVLRRLEGRFTMHGARWLIRTMGALLLGLAAVSAVGGLRTTPAAPPSAPEHDSLR